MTKWPTCPTCRRDMWQALVGAPVRHVRGCAHCGTREDTTPTRPVVDIDLPDELTLFEVPA